MKETLISAQKGGFFHIIISSSLVKIVSFISALFLPRFLTKTDYGLLTYVDNIRNYVLLLNGMGISNATLRYCARKDTDENKKGYFIASLVIGTAFDFLLIIVSVIAFLAIPFPFSGAKPLLLFMSVLPLLAFLLEDIQLLLRACFENRKYSVLSFLYSAFMVVLQIGMAVLWKLNGIVAARYLATAVCVVIGIVYVLNINMIHARAVNPDRKVIIEMIRLGIVMLAANAASYVMQLNETFVIGQVLKSESALADYKVASYILTVSLFLLQSVIIFVFPYFVKHMDDKQWIWSRFKKLFYLNAAVMIPIHTVLILFSKQIIQTVFGAAYLNAVPVMQVLLIASLGQAVFRGLTGNILAGIGEEKYNLNINIIFTILHVLIDIWAVKTFGLNGAAVALTAVYFASGIIMMLHLKKVCKSR